MTESCKTGSSSRMHRGGRIGVRLGLAAGLLVGCDPTVGSAPVTEIPEYNLRVDCTTNSAARAQREILVVHNVQILKLFVVGAGYHQESRVQIFHNSDVNISGPNGTEPRQSVASSDLDKGLPVSTNLQYGSLTVLRSAQPTTPANQASAAPSPLVTALPTSSQQPQEWLTFTLSCAAAPNATPTPAPQPSN